MELLTDFTPQRGKNTCEISVAFQNGVRCSSMELLTDFTPQRGKNTCEISLSPSRMV